VCIVTLFFPCSATCKILIGKNSAICIVLVQVTHMWDAVPTSVKGAMSVNVLKKLALFKNMFHMDVFGDLRQLEFKYCYVAGGHLLIIRSHSVCMLSVHNFFLFCVIMLV
jgi:hypothetical protein